MPNQTAWITAAPNSKTSICKSCANCKFGFCTIHKKHFLHVETWECTHHCMTKLANNTHTIKEKLEHPESTLQHKDNYLVSNVVTATCSI